MLLVGGPDHWLRGSGDVSRLRPGLDYRLILFGVLVVKEFLFLPRQGGQPITRHHRLLEAYHVNLKLGTAQRA